MSRLFRVLSWCKIPSVQVCIAEGETNKCPDRKFVGVTFNRYFLTNLQSFFFRLGLDFPPGFNPDLLKPKVFSDVDKD